MSGLQINYEKTQVVWIGSRKNCNTRYLRDMNFCWDPGIFKVLGIRFSVEVDQIVEINYQGKLNEIKRILNIWSKRHLTPLGKITVIKTLALSKIVHLFMNLPDPGQPFMKDLEGEFF